MAVALGLGGSHPPPPRTPVSPFRLRKKSECVSRRLRLSSSTKVRGPLALTWPSEDSCSSHKRVQARAAGPHSIFLFLPKNPSTCTPEVPSKVSQSRLGVVEFHPEAIWVRRGRAPGADSGSIRARSTIGSASEPYWREGGRPRLPKGNGSILERQLCGRGQSAGLFISTAPAGSVWAVACTGGAGAAAPDLLVGPLWSWADSGLGTRPNSTTSREEGVGKIRAGTGAC